MCHYSQTHSCTPHFYNKPPYTCNIQLSIISWLGLGLRGQWEEIGWQTFVWSRAWTSTIEGDDPCVVGLRRALFWLTLLAPLDWSSLCPINGSVGARRLAWVEGCFHDLSEGWFASQLNSQRERLSWGGIGTEAGGQSARGIPAGEQGTLLISLLPFLSRVTSVRELLVEQSLEAGWADLGMEIRSGFREIHWLVQ